MDGMNSIDQQFVEFIVKSLVSNPDAVTVDRRIDEKGVLLELTVDPEDLGRVIGKRGATAQSLRTLLRALGTKNDARYNLKIVDNGIGGHAYDDNSDGDGGDSGGDGGASDDKPVSAAAAISDDTIDKDDDDSDRESSRVSKTRRELADLDDLDV